jgi:hypothetical protein
VQLIRSRRDDDGLLHRRLLELLYEMARIQRLRPSDLCELSSSFPPSFTVSLAHLGRQETKGG